MSRELAQLEDLLQWAIGCHGNDHQDVVAAKEMKERAYYIQKVQQINFIIFQAKNLAFFMLNAVTDNIVSYRLLMGSTHLKLSQSSLSPSQLRLERSSTASWITCSFSKLKWVTVCVYACVWVCVWRLACYWVWCSSLCLAAENDWNVKLTTHYLYTDYQTVTIASTCVHIYLDVCTCM